jgi:excisionase family DNA binding protein
MRQVHDPSSALRDRGRHTGPRRAPRRTERGATGLHKLLLTVEEAAQRLGIGRTVMNRLVSSGSVESVTVGSLRRVPAEWPSDFVASLRRLSDPRGEGWVLLWMNADRKSGAPSIARD